jgi:hypothetical protein
VSFIGRLPLFVGRRLIHNVAGDNASRLVVLRAGLRTRVT